MPTSTSEPRSRDPTRSPNAELSSAYQGTVPGPPQALRSLLTSLGYHCSVQVPTNSRAVGVRSEGTPIPIANPETPSMNPPHTSPKSPDFPQRHSSVHLPEGTRPTEARFTGPLRPPQEPAAEPRPLSPPPGQRPCPPLSRHLAPTGQSSKAHSHPPFIQPKVSSRSSL